jgi:hypothetical protein
MQGRERNGETRVMNGKGTPLHVLQPLSAETGTFVKIRGGVNGDIIGSHSKPERLK